MAENLADTSVIRAYAQDRGIALSKADKSARDAATFLTHSNPDHDAIFDFPIGIELALEIACINLAAIAERMPIEVEVFDAWWWAAQVTDLFALSQETKNAVTDGVRSGSSLLLKSSKGMGWETLCRHQRDARVTPFPRATRLKPKA